MNKLALILAILSGCIFGIGVTTVVLAGHIETMETGLTEIHQMEMETEKIKQDDLQAQIDSLIIDKDNLELDIDKYDTLMEWVFEDRERVEEFFVLYHWYDTDDYDEDEFDRRIKELEEQIYIGTGIEF